MAAKIASGIVTFLISIAVAIVVLFFMLIAMNGYSESDATWGLGTFVILSLLIAIVMALAALFFAGALIKREMKPILAALIAVPVCSLIAGGLIIVSSFIGILVTESVRVHY